MDGLLAQLLPGYLMITIITCCHVLACMHRALRAKWLCCMAVSPHAVRILVIMAA
jgi:hypothetical protein